MTLESPLRIVIVDDHARLSGEAFRALLESQTRGGRSPAKHRPVERRLI